MVRENAPRYIINPDGEITLVLDGVPIEPDDAVDKRYVDGAIAAAIAGSGAVTSVSGTPGQITSTGGANPVLGIDPGYIGQTSITTLGTITTGVWNGSTIDTSHGGTGVTSFTPNGVLFGNGSGNILVTAQGAANTVLLGNGGVPSFGVVPNAALANSSITINTIGGITGGGTVSLGGTINLTVPPPVPPPVTSWTRTFAMMGA